MNPIAIKPTNPLSPISITKPTQTEPELEEETKTDHVVPSSYWFACRAREISELQCINYFIPFSHPL